MRAFFCALLYVNTIIIHLCQVERYNVKILCWYKDVVVAYRYFINIATFVLLLSFYLGKQSVLHAFISSIVRINAWKWNKGMKIIIRIGRVEGMPFYVSRGAVGWLYELLLLTFTYENEHAWLLDLFSLVKFQFIAWQNLILSTRAWLRFPPLGKWDLCGTKSFSKVFDFDWSRKV